MNLSLDFGMFAHEMSLILSAGALGLLAGALLAEGSLLLPYFRSLSAESFYELHPVYGPKLMRFFAPLTIAAPLLASVAAGVAWAQGGPVERWLASTAALLAWSLVAIYLGFFKAANLAFSRHEVAPLDLPHALARWAAWHRVRTVVCVSANACALLALAVA